MSLAPAASRIDSRRRPPLLGAAWLAGLGLACAASAEPRVTVRTVADQPLAGRLLHFSLEEGLTLAVESEGAPQRIPAGDLVQIVVADQGSHGRASTVRVDLTGGDLLYGRVVASGDDTVTLETDSIGRVEVPLGRITLWRARASADAAHGARVAALAGQAVASGEDVLLLANGDVLAGFVARIDEVGLVMETRSGELRVAHDSVVGVALVPTEEGWTGSAGQRPRVRVHTTDGQRLTATDLDWSDTGVVAVLFDGRRQPLPADRIARLDVVGGRWEWLGALEPISYEHQPAFGLHWDWRVDRNVRGGPLRVAGASFERGLGMHSESSLTFDLRGDYREFVTSFGLDDDSGLYANVDVEIRVDGKRRFSRDGILPGELHGPLRLDVRGADRIKLTVLFGTNADLQDRFDWIEAALIR